VASRLSPLLLQRPQAYQETRLDSLMSRLVPAMGRRLERLPEHLLALSKLYSSVDPDRPQQRGFAGVAQADGALAYSGAGLGAGEAVAITFGDRVTRQAVIDGEPGERQKSTGPTPRVPKPRRTPDAPPQGEVF